MRSDLIETFKTVNRKYDINPELFFQLDEGDRRGHNQKLFKKRFRLMLGNMHFRIGLLIIAICCLPGALTVVLLTLSGNTSRLKLNQKL